MHLRLFFSLVLAVACFAFSSCGGSEEPQKAASRPRKVRPDSTVLRIGVMPSADCLPLFVAEARGLFAAAGQKVQLVRLHSLFECSQALRDGRVEVAFCDMVRLLSERSKQLDAVVLFATDTRAALLASPQSRMTAAGQLANRLVGIERFACSAFFFDAQAVAANIAADDVLPVQVNDPASRLDMLLASQIDAAVLPEPYLSAALRGGCRQLAAYPQVSAPSGVFVAMRSLTERPLRCAQLDRFVSAYNKGVDVANSSRTLSDSILKAEAKLSPVQAGKIQLPSYVHARLPEEASFTQAGDFLVRSGATERTEGFYVVCDERFTERR